MIVLDQNIVVNFSLYQFLSLDLFILLMLEYCNSHWNHNRNNYHHHFHSKSFDWVYLKVLKNSDILISTLILFSKGVMFILIVFLIFYRSFCFGSFLKFIIFQLFMALNLWLFVDYLVFLIGFDVIFIDQCILILLNLLSDFISRA